VRVTVFRPGDNAQREDRSSRGPQSQAGYLAQREDRSLRGPQSQAGYLAQREDRSSRGPQSQAVDDNAQREDRSSRGPRSQAGYPVAVMVTVRPPGPAPAGPLRLQTAQYQRPVPHIKHLGGFGQGYHANLARRDGYDDALLVGPDGTI